MAGLLKKTTGLVGLAVCDTPHERLTILYSKLLDIMKLFPKQAAYRKYTEQITSEKLEMVKAVSSSAIGGLKRRTCFWGCSSAVEYCLTCGRTWFCFPIPSSQVNVAIISALFISFMD
ncbi:NADH dehydrogenase [ubiquinone] 1 alpha subcomplex subunit 5 isoform X1 [Psammomys obesus]|uniref:NADH dehydrogenase [ubiquinone] 1 alpha subcomplex subunit 5 isoform X1 n=1 Tax=Psammomys obesus TaxID=48139 RepID=UPI0024533626|nr:NADH dehydrogenase [ubiquinone] 1 alpha subcomplex subunit 5 isoform X1 [Psammomys obesus]